MPNILTVHRGFAGRGNDGLSWTLSEMKAEWFARRFPGLDGVTKKVSGTCAKSDVIAYLKGRKEEEIIIEPRRRIGRQ